MMEHQRHLHYEQIKNQQINYLLVAVKVIKQFVENVGFNKTHMYNIITAAAVGRQDMLKKLYNKES